MELTICIPTYNRAKYLERCLNSILSQLDYGQPDVKVAIFDNCSTDNTEQVVSKFIEQYPLLTYFKNTKNLGPDSNIGNCYMYPQSGYVWVLGDDDVLLDGCLKLVMDLLNKNIDPGVIFLNFYTFKNDYLLEKPKFLVPKNSYEFDGGNILSKIVSNVSFISANIVNTRFIDKEAIKESTGSCLNQMPGIISAITKSKKNIFINEYLLAQQSENSTGYKYFNVFGNNFPQLIEKYVVNKTQKAWILNQVIINVFPRPLLQSRQEINADIEHNAYEIIKPHFKQYFSFWVTAYPIHKLPFKVAVVYTFVIRVYAKMYALLRRIPGGKVIKLNANIV